MKNSTRYILIILLLVASWWFQNLLDRKPELITRDKIRLADYYLEDFKLTAHNKQGNISYTLKAKRLDHFENEALAEIKEVHAEVYNQDANWRITANKANLFQNDNKIEFYGNVEVTREKQSDRPDFSLKTDEITLLTKKEIMETSSPVTVQNGKNILKSKGLSYDNQKGVLVLKSNVKGIYVK